jgi:hypothetical protein
MFLDTAVLVRRLLQSLIEPTAHRPSLGRSNRHKRKYLLETRGTWSLAGRKQHGLGVFENMELRKRASKRKVKKTA